MFNVICLPMVGQWSRIARRTIHMTVSSEETGHRCRKNHDPMDTKLVGRQKKRSISAITMANDCWLFPVLPQNRSAIGCFLKCDWGFIQELRCITANWFLTVSCIYWYIRPSWCTVGHFKILNFDINVLYITAQNIEVYGWSLSLQKQTWTKTQV